MSTYLLVLGCLHTFHTLLSKFSHPVTLLFNATFLNTLWYVFDIVSADRLPRDDIIKNLTYALEMAK